LIGKNGHYEWPKRTQLKILQKKLREKCSERMFSRWIVTPSLVLILCNTERDFQRAQQFLKSLPNIVRTKKVNRINDLLTRRDALYDTRMIVAWSAPEKFDRPSLSAHL